MAEETRSPEFGEAVRLFQEFLRGQGWPERLLWLRSDDLGRVVGGPIILLGPPGDDGRADITRSYERGRRANLGVSLEAVCTHEGATCAIVAYPADARDAELLMYPSDGSLKLSVAVLRTEAARQRR